MTTALILISLAQAAAIVAWAMTRSRAARLGTLLDERKARAEAEQQLLQQLLQKTQAQAEEQLEHARSESDRQIRQLRDQLADSQSRLEALRGEHTRLLADSTARDRELELLKEQSKRDTEALEARNREQIENLKISFRNVANEILDAKSRSLKSDNDEHIAPMVRAIREQMDKIESTMLKTREDGVANKASIDKAIEQMMARTVEVGVEADKLARALRGEQKKQGIYGELVLSKILEDSGLKEGVNFDMQQMIFDAAGKAVRNDDTARRMIPDVVVHIDEKDLVIDSKTSLTAYLDWCNAENDEMREAALRQHIRSIRSHVDELVAVSYPTYFKRPGHTTIDYTVMFIPNEDAFQLMMQHEPRLWHEAYERKVIITSQLALFSMLRLIQISWLRVEQQRNQEQILIHAANLMKRVGEFNRHFEEIGDKLAAATQAFGNARNKLLDGRQSIAVSGRKLAELGAKVDAAKPLPEPAIVLPGEQRGEPAEDLAEPAGEYPAESGMKSIAAPAVKPAAKRTAKSKAKSSAKSDNAEAGAEHKAEPDTALVAEPVTEAAAEPEAEPAEEITEGIAAETAGETAPGSIAKPAAASARNSADEPEAELSE